VFVNGLGFEGWMDRLIAASKTKATVVTVSKSVSARQGEEGAPIRMLGRMWPTRSLV
jgi:zinc/manganese transport system substrate-binding protein